MYYNSGRFKDMIVQQGVRQYVVDFKKNNGSVVGVEAGSGSRLTLLLGGGGGLMGGPQCCLSILRNGNVTCRYFRKFPVDFEK